VKSQGINAGAPLTAPLVRGSAVFTQSGSPVAPQDSFQASAAPTSEKPSAGAKPSVEKVVLEKTQAISTTPAILSMEGPSFLGAVVSERIGRLFGDELTPLRVELDKINQLESKVSDLRTPEQFAAKTQELKSRLASGESMDDLRPEAYAVAREAARQATKMRAFDVQVLGALAMDDGHISEMRTGEGKTLTAVLPLYLNALAGKGAHLITVNETLAKRDAEWMGPIFERLGMTVGCVTEQQTAEEKRAGYNCDVTYVSDRALGFDFLRDRSVYHPSDKVQRPLFFALVDEVDEVLLDEARTPMIISSKSDSASDDYGVFGEIVKGLVAGEDFKLDEERNSVWLTDGGLRLVENELVLREAEQAQDRAVLEKATALRQAIRQENQLQKQFDQLDYHRPNLFAGALGFEGQYDREAATAVESSLKLATAKREEMASQTPGLNLYDEKNMHRVAYLDASLRALTLFRKGDDYTVEGGQLKIVDGNKGRVSEGKRFGRGLHQALEAKEGLEIQAETRSVSKITMPELMAQYERKAGMTGTGKTSEAEFKESYGLDVIEIPTNQPVIREDKLDVVFSTKEAKLNKVSERAIQEAMRGRPVLLGTISVNANRELADRILKAGWPADRLQILNADTVRGGADSIDADAGRSGTVTLVTGQRTHLVNTDAYNFKKLAATTRELLDQGRSVLLDVPTAKEAEEISAWLGGSQGLQIRIGQPTAELPPGLTRVDAADFRVDKPLLLRVGQENREEVLAQALEAFHQGGPVIVEAASSRLLGESAAFLLDHGLGLNSIPMVCEGKEKENVMIEMAGRSGMITVATNMAGRGADIKPDLIAVTQIAEAAYAKASENQPTTITVEKESQALKLERLLKQHICVSSTKDPAMEAKPGEVLIRFGQDLPLLSGDSHLSGSKFATKGLLVLGTERASSRRIDNQLIGRSGRQGAEGESQFYLSLEDEIPRVFGGEELKPLVNLFGDGENGLSSVAVSALLERAQERVENQHFDQRYAASKSYQVHKSQRESWYGLRDRVLSGEEDSGKLVSNYAAQGLGQLLRAELGEKLSYGSSEIEGALKELGIALPLVLEQTVAAENLGEQLYPAVSQLMSHANLDQEKLRIATLGQMDVAWRNHLEAMESMQDGIGLESYAGQDPDLVFGIRAKEVFAETVGDLKREMASVLLPVASRVA
jgi:preprotein translocase subunit SecA